MCNVLLEIVERFVLFEFIFQGGFLFKMRRKFQVWDYTSTNLIFFKIWATRILQKVLLYTKYRIICNVYP